MAEPSRPLHTGPMRWALLALAVTSLVLGVVGLFLPVMPTVPFILVAAWAAGRSSPRLRAWLESHPRFGPHLRDWEAGGVVPRKAKWTATILMTCSAIFLMVVLPAEHRWVAYATASVMALVALWLWRRPESVQGPSESGSA